MPEGKVLSGDTPVWEIQTAQLNRKLSLREGAALSGDWGTVAICGREVLYTPETNALWSDPQAADTGWSGFCPGYLTVLAFGDPEDRAENLLPMAREFYQAYLNEKVLPVKQVQGQRIRAVSGNLEAEVEQRETGIGLTGVKGWNGFTAVDLRVHVMPYINGRLWDTRDHEGEDREFTQKAFPWATKAENGSLYLEHYESHEPDGSYCQLASMCPSSGVWKEKMAYTLKRLFHEFGVSAVYIDQISAVPPVLCMDPSHHHLPGGGSWWTEQYNLLLRRCGQIKGEHGVITSESVAEVYAQSLDGLLTWVWVGDDLVPAFPVVYAGYLLMLGRNTNGLKKRDLAFFRYHAAQAFLFGQQMGWSNLDLAEDEEKLPFLRKLVRLRTKYAPYFYRGELLHPVSVSSNLSDTYTLPYVWETRLFQIKQVQGAMWRLWDQSGTLLFLANTSDQEASFTATLTGDFCQPVIEDGQVVLSAWEREKNGITLSGTLSAQEMAVIRLEENKEFLSSCQ